MNTPTGLYDPAYEHDACGVAFVARLDAVPSHETVERATALVASLSDKEPHIDHNIVELTVENGPRVGAENKPPLEA